MNEKPILFSTEMVRAILDGRKTQTRRVVKGQALTMLEDFTPAFVADPGNSAWCPFGKKGDLLWVRETWLPIDQRPDGVLQKVWYKADQTENNSMPWRPSIHLKKEHSRIWLQVTDVRVERLNQITEEDAVAEGVEQIFGHYLVYSAPDKPNSFVKANYSFFSLWQSINGKESLEANPWVWVISFNVLSTTGKPENI